MEDISLIGASLVLGLFFGLIVGVAIAEPKELENGCIVDNDKIYCEYKVGE